MSHTQDHVATPNHTFQVLRTAWQEASLPPAKKFLPPALQEIASLSHPSPLSLAPSPPARLLKSRYPTGQHQLPYRSRPAAEPSYSQCRPPSDPQAPPTQCLHLPSAHLTDISNLQTHHDPNSTSAHPPKPAPSKSQVTATSSFQLSRTKTYCSHSQVPPAIPNS